MSGTFLSLMMLAAFALAAGGVWQLRTGREQSKAILMLVAALVLFGNVLLAVL